MQAPQRIRDGRPLWMSLIAVWLLGAAWTIATVPTPAPFPVHEAPLSALDLVTRAGSATLTSWPQHEQQEMRGTTDDSGDSVTPTPKRGIRPPWRENAIPELRRQPGQKPKASAA